jgi:hypothetical protein
MSRRRPPLPDRSAGDEPSPGGASDHLREGHARRGRGGVNASRSARAKARSASAPSVRKRLGCQPTRCWACKAPLSASARVRPAFGGGLTARGCCTEGRPSAVVVGSERRGRDVLGIGAPCRRGPGPSCQLVVAMAVRQSLSRLWVPHSSFHWVAQARRPRRMNRQPPWMVLTCPKTGSMVRLRWA